MRQIKETGRFARVLGLRPGLMSPEVIQSFLAIALGFAVAGMISSLYQYLTRRAPSFALLSSGASPAAFAAVPFLAFAAPFIIMSHILRERGPTHRRIETVMLATVAASFWSMMSGTVVLMAVEAAQTLFS